MVEDTVKELKEALVGSTLFDTLQPYRNSPQKHLGSEQRNEVRIMFLSVCLNRLMWVWVVHTCANQFNPQ